MTFAQYMGMFNQAMQFYAEVNQVDGGPYMLRWLDKIPPHTQRSEYQDSLEPAAVRALALSHEAKNGEVLAYVGSGCVWRTYWPAIGTGPLIGAGPQLAGVVAKRDSRDSGTGVRYAGVFTLQFRKAPTLGYTTAQYVGLIQALFAAHALVRKYNTKVAVFSADGTRRFTVSEVHDPVLRAVYPNRARKPKTLAECEASPSPEPELDDDGDEQGPNVFGFDPDDDIDRGAPPPIIQPAPAGSADHAPQLNPHSDDLLPSPPFVAGQTHYLFTQDAISYVYGPDPKDPVEFAKWKRALTLLPTVEERARYRDMYLGGKP
jgi:hypothetical protein